jgi:hypothetical protein
VEAKDASHLFEKRDLLEAVDVNPGDGRPVRGRQGPFQGIDFLFLETGFVVFAEVDLAFSACICPI